MSQRFNRAIIRRPCQEMVNGITTVRMGKPDPELANIQHRQYEEALRQCGLKVEVLESDSRFPDSVFIEDVAVCTPSCAIITNPGAPSRRGEPDQVREVLWNYYTDIEEIVSPGRLDAGDVMMVENHYYIGLSGRTNHTGAAQLIRILEKYGLSGSTVPLRGILHLKTGVSYLENNNLLVCGPLKDEAEFLKYNKIEISSNEAYAANSLWINGVVLVPRGFPETSQKIEKAGYPIIVADVSEFQKLDGGLSCLSLRF